ncbi:hypothetical protein J7290_001554 [Vibrio parahaemolyticus]|nr:hypothetical protein [Vibrio parahaemolyticus]
MKFVGFELILDKESKKVTFRYNKSWYSAVSVPLFISGFFSLTVPWWLPLVEPFLKRHDIPTFEPEVEWGLALFQILIACILLFLGKKEDKKRTQLTIDKSTWQKSPVRWKEVEKFISDLYTSRSYTTGNDSSFYESYTYFCSADKEFQFPKLQAEYIAFSKAAKELHSFLSTRVHPYPDSQPLDENYKYCFMPDHDIDRNLSNFSDPSISKKFESECSILDDQLSLLKSKLDVFQSLLKSSGIS